MSAPTSPDAAGAVVRARSGASLLARPLAGAVPFALLTLFFGIRSLGPGIAIGTVAGMLVLGIAAALARAHRMSVIADKDTLTWHGVFQTNVVARRDVALAKILAIGSVGTSRPYDWFILIDGAGRCIQRIPLRFFVRKDIESFARDIGVPCAAYDKTFTPKEAESLFPGSVEWSTRPVDRTIGITVTAAVAAILILIPIALILLRARR